MLKLHEMSSRRSSQARPNNRLQRTAFDVVACAARACGEIMRACAAQDMFAGGPLNRAFGDLDTAHQER
jgi:hypothetical protein